MKKLIVSLAIASSALIATAPASAQRYGGYHGGNGGNVYQRLTNIDNRIERNFQRGSLTRMEAQRLSDESRGVRRLAARYTRDGLSRWERNDLERRVDRLQYQLQRQRFDDDRRDWRY